MHTRGEVLLKIIYVKGSKMKWRIPIGCKVVSTWYYPLNVGHVNINIFNGSFRLLPLKDVYCQPAIRGNIKSAHVADMRLIEGTVMRRFPALYVKINRHRKYTTATFGSDTLEEPKKHFRQIDCSGGVDYI